jgi:CelD/BcsL family acetyltransferase involved in cellulose biosynthesis
VIATTDRTPPPIVDLQEAATRNRAARRIVAGFSAALPTLEEIWRQLEAALADTPALSAEISAHLDGEPDPLAYLRDELAARGQLPTDPGSRP